ncbi:hypothetical protein PGT21_026060 [Puccinia graminis f. sp. tritici]|uniref:Uncharacterized protein n=1 Tax=Puccinia graminis f. sp. tritici TaxID=56615 RepID=A0A5B0NFB6_PUCGR|nr:hypothetical protein PGT21_026060 [Puccinia graminis f. sp. tritici]
MSRRSWSKLPLARIAYLAISFSTCNSNPIPGPPIEGSSTWVPGGHIHEGLQTRLEETFGFNPDSWHDWSMEPHNEFDWTGPSQLMPSQAQINRNLGDLGGNYDLTNGNQPNLAVVHSMLEPGSSKEEQYCPNQNHHQDEELKSSIAHLESSQPVSTTEQIHDTGPIYHQKNDARIFAAFNSGIL